MTELKEINYRKGLVRFSIPTFWVEEYARDGAGTFYDARPEAGMLRLTITTLESLVELTDASTFQVLSSRKTQGSREFIKLGEGIILSRYARPFSEAGRHLLLHSWEVAIPLPPRNMRLILFTYTIDSSLSSDPAVRRDLVMLEAQIVGAKFSREEVTAKNAPKRSWWKLWDGEEGKTEDGSKKIE